MVDRAGLGRPATGGLLLVALLLLAPVGSDTAANPRTSPSVSTPLTGDVQAATAGPPTTSPITGQATTGLDVGQLAPDFTLPS